MVTDTETFALATGVSAEQFLALEDAIQSWSYLNRKGLRRRTTARGGDGQWLVLTWWDDATFAVGLDSMTNAPEVAAWRAAIDAASYRRASYQLLA